MSQEEARDTKEIEKCFLLSICEILGQTGEAPRNRDFAFVQGALRGVYNSLGELIYNSKYLSDTRKKLLERFNNNIFKIRDNLVIGVEVDKIDLAEVVNSNNICGRVGSTKAALERYIGYWYDS